MKELDMSRTFQATSGGWVARVSVVFVVVTMAGRPLYAQARDSFLNGTLIGAATGAGVGIAFTHATRDSDLQFDQYAYGALVFGAIGAGAGLGIDALLNRSRPGREAAPRRVSVAPALWHDVAGVLVSCRW
jgi:hypothetical protein